MKSGKRTDGSDAFQKIIRYAKTDAQTHEIGRLRMLRDKDRQGQNPRNEERDWADTGTETKPIGLTQIGRNRDVRDESQRNRKGG